MGDNVIEFRPRAVAAAAPAQAEPTAEVIDALLDILTAAKASGCMDRGARLAFAAYALGVVPELRSLG
jgi:hypothetical protein